MTVALWKNETEFRFPSPAPNLSSRAETLQTFSISKPDRDNHYQLSSYWAWNDVATVKLAAVLCAVANV